MRKTKAAPSGMTEDVRIQEFLDMIAPSVIKFETDHLICGNTFRCVWALREYPTATEEQALMLPVYRAAVMLPGLTEEQLELVVQYRDQGDAEISPIWVAQ